MIAHTQEDRDGLRKSGSLLAEILRETAKLVKPGLSTAALDIAAEKMIRARGAVPAFLNYKPDGAAYPYPAALCVSINDEVVHGIPSADRMLKAGDMLMLDLGLSYNGYFADMAMTVCVGECDAAGIKLIKAAREALDAAVGAVRPGVRIGDIGAAISAVAKKHGLGVVEELGGHSLGKRPHEEPFVPNVGTAGQGPELVEGQVLALEPIFTEGSGDVALDDDQWTYRTADGSRSAEFEHTVIVTKDGADILTR